MEHDVVAILGELGPLIDHCRDKSKVYHLGFEEYAQTMTGEAQ
jgi:hypothetical protein